VLAVFKASAKDELHAVDITRSGSLVTVAEDANLLDKGKPKFALPVCPKRLYSCCSSLGNFWLLCLTKVILLYKFDR
jgi:hypothetical protein